VHAVKHSDRASRSSCSGSNTCYARTRTTCTSTTCTSTSTRTCTSTTWSCTSVVSPFL
jgi:hypothetical protein